MFVETSQLLENRPWATAAAGSENRSDGLRGHLGLLYLQLRKPSFLYVNESFYIGLSNKNLQK